MQNYQRDFGFKFESDLWRNNSRSTNGVEYSDPNTPALTPTPANGSKIVDTDDRGFPIFKNLTSGVHWNPNSYPGWTQNNKGFEFGDEDYNSTASSSLNGPNSNKSKEDYKNMDEQLAFFNIDYIASVVDEVRNTLGFQFDASINVFELLMSQLDSRASRMSRQEALRSLHNDYISGLHSNFRKWYFAAEMDVLDRELERKYKSAEGLYPFSATENTNFGEPQLQILSSQDQNATQNSEQMNAYEFEEITLQESQDEWDYFMQSSSNKSRLVDVIIYLSCWTEANQIRFMPECLAFIVESAKEFYYNEGGKNEDLVYPGYFLENVITPLYSCYRLYNYQKISNRWVHKDGDHKSYIGYDDMNQLFWYRKGLEKIKLVVRDLKKEDDRDEMMELVRLPKHEWYTALAHVNWLPVFNKTYRETRTWLHVLTNFSRMWILHLSMFWFYTSANSSSLYVKDYNYMDPQSASMLFTMAVTCLGGSIGPFLTVLGLFGELRFVPRSFAGAEPVFYRLIVTIILLAVHLAGCIAIIVLNPWKSQTFGFNAATSVGMTLIVFSAIYTLYYSTIPPKYLYNFTFGQKRNRSRSKANSNSSSSRRFLANKYFTASFPKLTRKGVLISWMMWILVYTSKFLESYFYLSLNLKDPLRELKIMDLNELCVSERFLGNFICSVYPKVVLFFLVVTDFVLFCLDTYLWYVIFNTLISISIALQNGTSIWTPWTNAFSRLPQRISAKILAPKLDVQQNYSDGFSLRIIWNSIVESMRAENLLNYEESKKLMYINPSTGEPRFFTVEEDSKYLGCSEQTGAYRRVSFFAQSLSTPMPNASSVDEMPAFTVLVPYYKEKMILSLSETIKAGAQSKITILEYLQKLYPSEWENYVEDVTTQKKTAKQERSKRETSRNSFMVLQKLGFDSLDPNDTNKTRLWCSKRAQTLYRTISGFANYSSAIKVLYLSESEEVPDEEMIHNAHSLCNRKFRLLVAMQLYQSFDEDQLRDLEMILSEVPDLVISYVEHKKNQDGVYEYYSCLFDSTCPLLDTGKRIPKIRIKLSGDPILGDGKSDNQNSVIPFYRGEYIQLVDANQDNYLEECLKIRNLLMEFQTSNVCEPDSEEDYDSESCGFNDPSEPVAIVGAREYIFSENIGILGDVAAGKEQTFGTLFARTLATVGAKLHYGHPDFVNGIFMTTRGGISKGQRGLHLNEDIYAGMTAVLRGGRIRHSEYLQCGKGRDLGFVSILNFTSKIGAGMGEQILSREYYYMGTQLPIDRFTSFYFAHPGFHINNLFITLALELLLLIILWAASIASVNTICDFDQSTSLTAPHTPSGCINIIPLLHWIRHCVISIFLVFFVSLCPLFFHELIEKGLLVSLTRVLKHFASLSMFFEVFVAHIYARSFAEDLNVGGARYVATGRDFATNRANFHKLYSGYSTEIIIGINAMLALVYASSVLWHPCYLWFWITSVSLCVSPNLYNPHQFSFFDFFLDYGSLLHWFFRSSGDKDTWVQYIRLTRQKITGISRTSRKNTDVSKPNFRNMVLIQLGTSLLYAMCYILPYAYVTTQMENENAGKMSALVRISLCSGLPIAASLVVHCLMFLISIFLNLIQIKNFADIIAMCVHCTSVLLLIASWWVIHIFEDYNILVTILGVMAEYSVHRLVCTVFTICLHKQYSDSQSNTPWWNGKWQNVGWRCIYLIPNELVTKLTESIDFSYDFIACHALLITQIPLVLFPYSDKVHSLFLLWLRPSVTSEASKVSSIAISKKQRQKNKFKAFKYLAAFTLVCATVCSLLTLPLFVPHRILDQVAYQTTNLLQK